MTRFARLPERGKWLFSVVALAAVYYLAARLGLLLAFAATNVSPVWPPSGIALAALLLLGCALPPSFLCLEITEPFVLHDTELNLAVLRDLRALGIGIAIDDFGVGYSSLRYIKRFAPDRLKVDGSFVRDVVSDPDDATIVSAVIAIAKRLHIQVVAEGVENEAQRDFLASESCDSAQGFFYAHPCAADEFRAWLSRSADL